MFLCNPVCTEAGIMGPDFRDPGKAMLSWTVCHGQPDKHSRNTVKIKGSDRKGADTDGEKLPF